MKEYCPAEQYVTICQSEHMEALATLMLVPFGTAHLDPVAEDNQVHCPFWLLENEKYWLVSDPSQGPFCMYGMLDAKSMQYPDEQDRDPN